MADDILGANLNEKLMQAMAEPLLDGMVNWLRDDGYSVDVTHSNASHLIEFGKPGEPKNTAYGETLPRAIDDLFRNLTQLGLVPKEVRENQLQLQRQMRLIHDPVMEAIDHDLRKMLGDG